MITAKDIERILENPDVKEVRVTWKKVMETVQPDMVVTKYSKLIPCPVCKGIANIQGSSFIPCSVCQGKGVKEI